MNTHEATTEIARLETEIRQTIAARTAASARQAQVLLDQCYELAVEHDLDTPDRWETVAIAIEILEAVTDGTDLTDAECDEFTATLHKLEAAIG